MTPRETRDAIDAALERIEDFRVGPRLREALVAEGVLFAGTMCVGSDSNAAQQRCQESLGNPSVAANAIRESILSAVPGGVGLASLGDGDRLLDEHTRLSEVLARRIGRSISWVGMPPVVPTQFGIATAADSGLAFVETAGQATIPWSGDVVVLAGVMVTAVGGAAVDASQPQDQAARRLAPALSHFCDRGFVDPTELTYAFNAGRSTFAETDAERRANLSPMASSTTLTFDLIDRAGLCDADCEREIVDAFVIAVAAWRSGCARCAPNALSVVRSPGEVWLMGDAVDRFWAVSSGRAPPTALVLGDRPLVPGTAIPTPSLVGAPSSHRISYESVGPELRSEICSAPDLDAAWFGDAQRAICNGQSSGSNVVVSVALIPGGTSCGPATDAMACGLPDGAVEIAVGVTRFVGRDGRTLLDGDPDSVPVDIGTVLLHEAGHWFGVPHHYDGHPELYDEHPELRQRRTDVMDDFVFVNNGEHCLGASSLVMLNNAADRRWPHRQTTGGALRVAPVGR